MQKKKRPTLNTQMQRPLSFSDKHIGKVYRPGEQAHCLLSHWRLCRNTEVRGLQTFPSLLHPRGVLRYFHFTNNLRTIAQDTGKRRSHGEGQLTKQKNRYKPEPGKRPGLYLSEWPLTRGKVRKALSRLGSLKMEMSCWWLSSCCPIMVNLYNRVHKLLFRGQYLKSSGWEKYMSSYLFTYFLL